ncbi:hypothetical protein SASPL_139220 [Salvia splendens]|uniref:Enoyl reductase (ER) domain-containing protein n=1 Tax=Salvia splendens TaxID=180675 RepID=A0A8X8ZEM0_SALSN|nr:hypothetical protein SASPL_139220 [Salvia splendens]
MDEDFSRIVGNKQILFKGYIEGVPKESDMEFKLGNGMKLEAPKGSGAFLVKNLYLSCDPYMRGRMRDFHGSYIPPFVPGSVVEGFGVSKVIDSDNPNFKPGDIVSCFTGWEEYTLLRNTEQLRKVQPDDIPLSYHIGLLGMPGFTAYAGFYEVCAPKRDERVFVSAASGAVGQLVGQLAKLHGCYVVGSAGSKQKVCCFGILKASFSQFMHNIKYFPEGIDIYFENVGGAMLDAVLVNMRVHGRIAVCGMVSQAGIGASDQQGIRNLFSLVPKRVKMQGFLQSDYLYLFPRFVEQVGSLYKEGKITYLEDMNHGLESAPAAFAALFTGKNVGKQVVCVART